MRLGADSRIPIARFACSPSRPENENARGCGRSLFWRKGVFLIFLRNPHKAYPSIRATRQSAPKRSPALAGLGELRPQDYQALLAALGQLP